MMMRQAKSYMCLYKNTDAGMKIESSVLSISKQTAYVLYMYVFVCVTIRISWHIYINIFV